MTIETNNKSCQALIRLKFFLSLTNANNQKFFEINFINKKKTDFANLNQVIVSICDLSL